MSHFTAFDFLLLAIALLVLPLLSATSMARASRNRLARYRRIVIRNVILTLAILLAWYWEGRPWASLGLDIPISVWGWAGIGFAAALIGFYAIILRSRITPGELESARREWTGHLVAPTNRSEFAAYQFVVVSAGIAEELLFRGFLFWALEPIAGMWGTVFIAAIVFASGHLYQGWGPTLRIALITVVFNVAYALTDSLWWLMLVHMVVNEAGALYARQVQRLASAEAPAQQAPAD